MKLKKTLLTTLSLALIFPAIGPSIANAETKIIDSDLKKEEQMDQNNNTVLFEDGIIINDKFYNADELSEYLDNVQIVDLAEEKEINTGISPAFAPAAGIYFIPGIGEVALAATGAIIIGGVTIKAGSALYKTIKSFFSNPQKVVASKYGIPKSLLDSNGKVKLGSFKDKLGNTPLKKASGSFKNGKWSVQKDTAGHGGRKWKLKKDGKRKASLDKNGKVLSK